MVLENAGVFSPFPEEMGFQLVILQDASAQADRYWCNWLWNRPQPAFGPSPDLLVRCAPHDASAVEAAWESWFSVLTSWDFADTLIGADLRALLADPVSR